MLFVPVSQWLRATVTDHWRRSTTRTTTSEAPDDDNEDHIHAHSDDDQGMWTDPDDDDAFFMDDEDDEDDEDDDVHDGASTVTAMTVLSAMSAISTASDWIMPPAPSSSSSSAPFVPPAAVTTTTSNRPLPARSVSPYLRRPLPSPNGASVPSPATARRSSTGAAATSRRPKVTVHYLQSQQTWHGHHRSVHSVAVSPDGHWIASGSTDKRILVWKTSSGGDVAYELVGHAYWVYCVVWCPRLSQDTPTTHAAAAAAQSPLYNIASASWDGTVKIWNVSTRTCLRTLKASGAEISSVDWLRPQWTIAQAHQLLQPQSHLVASTTKGQVLVWTITHASGPRRRHQTRLYKKLKRPTAQGRSVVQWGPTVPDEETEGSALQSVAIGWRDGKLLIWTFGLAAQDNENNKEEVAAAAAANTATSTPTRGNGNSTRNGTLPVTPDTITSKTPGTSRNFQQTLPGHSGHPIEALAWTPDGKCLASGAWDTRVRVWSVPVPSPTTNNGATARSRHHKSSLMVTLRGHVSTVTSLQWAPRTTNGDNDASAAFHPVWLASGSEDTTIKLWHVPTGTCHFSLESHQSSVNAIAWWWDAVQQKSLLVSGSDDCTLRQWELPVPWYEETTAQEFSPQASVAIHHHDSEPSESSSTGGSVAFPSHLPPSFSHALTSVSEQTSAEQEQQLALAPPSRVVMRPSSAPRQRLPLRLPQVLENPQKTDDGIKDYGSPPRLRGLHTMTPSTMSEASFTTNNSPLSSSMATMTVPPVAHERGPDLDLTALTTTSTGSRRSQQQQRRSGQRRRRRRFFWDRLWHGGRYRYIGDTNQTSDTLWWYSTILQDPVIWVAVGTSFCVGLVVGRWSNNTPLNSYSSSSSSWVTYRSPPRRWFMRVS